MTTRFVGDASHWPDVQVAALPLTAPRPADLHEAMDDLLAALPVQPPTVALFPAGTGPGAQADPEASDDGAAASFLEQSAALAKKRGVWLCPGTWCDDGGRHVTGLIAPDGTIVATQAQTHLAPGETFTPGTDLTIADTPFGPVGFLVGHDAWVPEVGRILARRGVRLLLAPVSARAPYTEWDQICGTWAQVQQNQVFAAEAGWTGPGFGGRPAVMAPCEMTDGLTGYLARPDSGPAVATLHEADRLAVKRNYDILGLQNPALYRRYLPGLYRRPAAGSGYPGSGGDRT